jgi:DNA anti-recombination protein RmuC
MSSAYVPRAKMRGAWGEVSLGNLLDQVLTVDQYDRNVEVKPGSNQRVEYPSIQGSVAASRARSAKA